MIYGPKPEMMKNCAKKQAKQKMNQRLEDAFKVQDDEEGSGQPGSAPATESLG